MIVIGLGSGRSGTASLANILNAQSNSLCFHEMNPSCVRYEGTPRPLINGIEDYSEILKGGDPSRLTVDLSRPVAATAYDQLCKMTQVDMLGDIAHYYLNYVDDIVATGLDVRFICLKRDRQQTIDSWQKKVDPDLWLSKRVSLMLSSVIERENMFKKRNPWMDHDGNEWDVDLVWDKCFPKFPGPTRAEAIAQYWDYYYEQADKLEAKYGDKFMVIHTPEMSAAEGQRKILDFCEIPRNKQILADGHLHKSGK